MKRICYLENLVQFCQKFVLYCCIICAYILLSPIYIEAAPSKDKHIKSTIFNTLSNNSRPHSKSGSFIAPQIAELSKYAGLVINAKTGEVLYSKNSTAKRYPASLVKMMTLLLAFEALEKGELKLNQMIAISKPASMQPPSRLGVAPYDKLIVNEVLHAICIKSANDMAYALGETLGHGSIKNFVRIMNIRAKQLGMYSTHFCNPSGLHAKTQVTTAYDMALLALALKSRYAKYYGLFSRTHFIFRHKTVVGHNRVLQLYPGATGMKTGYTIAAGYNLVTTTKKPEGELIAVVMGCPSRHSRDDHMISLLQSAYETLHHRSAHPAHKFSSINNRSTTVLSTHRKIPPQNIQQKRPSIFTPLYKPISPAINRKKRSKDILHTTRQRQNMNLSRQK